MKDFLKQRAKKIYSFNSNLQFSLTKYVPKIIFKIANKSILGIKKRFDLLKKENRRLLIFKRWISIEYFIACFFFFNLVLVLLIFHFVNKIQRIVLSSTISKPINASEYPVAENGQQPFISARSYVIYDKNARVIVDGKNEHLRFAPASTVKIMTAVVSLEHYKLSDVLEAKELFRTEGSSMGLFEGERMTVENLLYGLMLPSGNDAAFTLSYHYPGGIVGFVQRMNEKAKELRAENTYFYDASGYDDRNYTTAYDLARLGANALDNPVFAEIVKTRTKLVYDETRRISHPLSNLNKMLEHSDVLGIKTGFTDEAGGVLVTSVRYKNSTYIVAVLKSEERFLDTEEVVDKIVKRIERLRY